MLVVSIQSNVNSPLIMLLMGPPRDLLCKKSLGAHKRELVHSCKGAPRGSSKETSSGSSSRTPDGAPSRESYDGSLQAPKVLNLGAP